MNYYRIQSYLAGKIKSFLGINNLTVYLRRRKQGFQKLFYHKKYTADDIIDCLIKAGVKPGRPIVIHSAFGNFYNFKGSAEDLINKLISFVGPQGTLCMPAYPYDKFNSEIVFDVRHSESAAGYLTEVFRKYSGVKRSLNQLHSVCALGADAEYITGEHQLSRICFDEHSPYQKIAELGGYSVSLGMPKWYIGTAEHICEAKLYGVVPLFTNKFSIEKEFTYIDYDGIIFKHRMLASSNLQYVRSKSTFIVDHFFDKTKYSRVKLSNIWVTVFDIQYLSRRLEELALENKTIYASPKNNL